MIRGQMSMLQENIAMSVSNVFHNRMRSFLTTLGIIIGVAAVIAMVTTVSSVTGEISSQFAALGTGKFNVTANGTRLKPGLTRDDIAQLRAVDNVSGIGISTSSTCVVRGPGGWEDEVTLEGRNTDYFQRNRDAVSRGTELNPVDEEQVSFVCLVSPDLARTLYPGEEPLGQIMQVNGHTFRIVGMLSDTSGDVMFQALGNSTEKRIIVPYTTAMRLSGNTYIRSLEVYVGDVERTDETISLVKEQLTTVFNGRDDTYSVLNMASILDTMDTIMNMMTLMLAGIASISLLVGGIGIMNMMLVSVTERTTEIGLRKALGAEPGQIQLQFLIEAFILSLMGGILGTMLGLFLSYVLSVLIGSVFRISLDAIALGVGFSAVVGLVFGWAPARKASGLNPIDALRAV